MHRPHAGLPASALVLQQRPLLQLLLVLALALAAQPTLWPAPTAALPHGAAPWPAPVGRDGAHRDRAAATVAAVAGGGIAEIPAIARSSSADAAVRGRAAPPLPRTGQRQQRVVGGAPVHRATEYLFYGALYIRNDTVAGADNASAGEFLCGAALIAPRVALTAAHCTDFIIDGGGAVSAHVAFGANNISGIGFGTPGVYIANVSEYFTHPFWNRNIVATLAAIRENDLPSGGAIAPPGSSSRGSGGFGGHTTSHTLLTPNLTKPGNWSHNSYDVGLLVFDTAAYGGLAQPIALNPRPDVPEVNGSMVRVVGHGKTSANATNISDLLRDAAVPIVPNAVCRRDFGQVGVGITADMLCAGRGKDDACFGDSGSPFFTDANGDGIVRQVGIVSFGVGCAESAFPGVYARVSAAYDWIRTVVGNRTGFDV